MQVQMESLPRGTRAWPYPYSWSESIPEGVQPSRRHCIFGVANLVALLRIIRR